MSGFFLLKICTFVINKKTNQLMMKTIHSYWACIALVILIIACINAIVGYISKKEFKSKD